jgi:hypothetical protein
MLATRKFSTLDKARSTLKRVGSQFKKASGAHKIDTGTLHHGIYYRQDDYERIRYERSWQDAIIKREEAIFKGWRKKLLYHDD